MEFVVQCVMDGSDLEMGEILSFLQPHFVISKTRQGTLCSHFIVDRPSPVFPSFVIWSRRHFVSYEGFQSFRADKSQGCPPFAAHGAGRLLLRLETGLPGGELVACNGGT
eukprot:1139866-Pelagomonas_calceolata.AAC.4